MAVALPVELVVDDDALGRADRAVVGRQKVAGQRPGVGIDQTRVAVEAMSLRVGLEGPVGLQMIELARADARHEDAPDVAPAVQLGIEVDDFGRIAIVDAIVQQHAHARGMTAENHELHTAVVQNRPVRQRMREVQGGSRVGQQRHSSVNRVDRGSLRSTRSADRRCPSADGLSVTEPERPRAGRFSPAVNGREAPTHKNIRALTGAAGSQRKLTPEIHCRAGQHRAGPTRLRSSESRRHPRAETAPEGSLRQHRLASVSRVGYSRQLVVENFVASRAALFEPRIAGRCGFEILGVNRLDSSSPAASRISAEY